jgi:hypothetical protein
VKDREKRWSLRNRLERPSRSSPWRAGRCATECARHTRYPSRSVWTAGACSGFVLPTESAGKPAHSIRSARFKRLGKRKTLGQRGLPPLLPAPFSPNPPSALSKPGPPSTLHSPLSKGICRSKPTLERQHGTLPADHTDHAEGEPREEQAGSCRLLCLPLRRPWLLQSPGGGQPGPRPDRL